MLSATSIANPWRRLARDQLCLGSLQIQSCLSFSSGSCTIDHHGLLGCLRRYLSDVAKPRLVVESEPGLFLSYAPMLIVRLHLLIKFDLVGPLPHPL